MRHPASLHSSLQISIWKEIADFSLQVPLGLGAELKITNLQADFQNADCRGCLGERVTLHYRLQVTA